MFDMTGCYDLNLKHVKCFAHLERKILSLIKMLFGTIVQLY